MPEFNPIHLYDVPGLAISQAVGGTLSGGSLHDLLLSPDRLTPEERTSLTDRVVGSEGNPVMKAVVGAATNPWVWLMFLTSPVGNKALMAGKSLFAVKKAHSAYAKAGASFFQRIFGTSMELFTGTEVPEIALAASDRKQMLVMAHHKALEKPTQDLLAELNAKLPTSHRGLIRGENALDFDQYPLGSPMRQVVREWDLANAIYHSRLGEDLTEKVPAGLQRIKYRRRDNASQPWGPWEDVKAIAGAEGDQAAVDANYQALETTLARNRQDLRKSVDEQVRTGVLDPADAAAIHAEIGRGEHDLVETALEPMDLHYVDRKRPALMDPERAQQAWDAQGPAAKAYAAAMHQSHRDLFTEVLLDRAATEAAGVPVFDDDKLSMFTSRLMSSAGEADGQVYQGMDLLMKMVGGPEMEKIFAGLDPKMNEAVAKTIRERLKQAMTPERWADSRWMPLNTMDVMPVSGPKGKMYPAQSEADLLQINTAPHTRNWSLSKKPTGRLAPRTEADAFYHTDDLEAIRDTYGLSEEGEKELAKARILADKKYRSGDPNSSLLGYRLNYHRGSQAYVTDMAEASFHTTPVTDAVVLADAETMQHVNPNNLNKWVPRGLGGKLPVGTKLSDLPPEHRRKVSLSMAIDRSYLKLDGDPDRQLLLRQYGATTALGAIPPERTAVISDVLRTKRQAKWFHDSMVGQYLKKNVPQAKGFFDELERIADPSTRVPTGQISQTVANYLYTTHLGMNVSSALVNLTQPLILAATVGRLEDILPAYGAAFKESFGYASERLGMLMKGKVFITPAEQLAMVEKHFKYAGRATGGKNLLGIGPNFKDVWKEGLGAPAGKFRRAEQVMMSMFQQSDWMSRNISAHTLERAYTAAGRNVLTDGHFLSDLERFVLQTQYAPHPANTPLIFLKGPGKNALVRQFLTFPVRTLTNVASVFPTLGEEGYGAGLINYGLRAMGLSALTYEIGKGLFGADMSRGLVVSGVTDVWGGSRLLDRGNNWIPVPPVVDIPLTLIRGIAGEDVSMLADGLVRTVPGGVGISRALGIAPKLPGPGELLQKTYADYENPAPNGTVPVYKADGTLIEYRTPAEIVARAFGADLGTWGKQGGLDNYLAKQREEIVQYRHQYLMALGAQDYRKAGSLQAEFARRFKDEQGRPLPLTVTRAQVQVFMGNRSTGRTERALDRIPAELRPAYLKMATGSGAARNLPEGGLLGGPTARSRDEARGISSEELDRSVQDVLERQDRVGGGTLKPSSAFDSYTKF